MHQTGYAKQCRTRFNASVPVVCRAICVFNHVSYVDAIVLTHFFTLAGVAKARINRRVCHSE